MDHALKFLFVASYNLSFLVFFSALLWQLMRFNILQLLNKLRFHSQGGSQGKEISDADILDWANSKVKASGRTSRMESFKVPNEQNFNSYFCQKTPVA
jgi:hypothetical protein